MGLDMYLEADVYIGGKYYKCKQPVLEVSTKLLCKDDDFSEVKSYKTEHISSIVFEVGYWRKANWIHKWFVDNVQSGIDDCSRYYVEYDKLKELKDLCVELLEKKDIDYALSKLPPTCGCCFGTLSFRDSDGNLKEDDVEYYWNSLSDTINFMTNALAYANNGADIYYQSSW